MKNSSSLTQNGSSEKNYSIFGASGSGVILIIICAFYLFGVAGYNFISDDAFINFRYSQNLSQGHGLVFNPLSRNPRGFSPGMNAADRISASGRESRTLVRGDSTLNERVEGFTTPLWIIVLAGLRLLGFDLLFISRLLGIIAGLISIILTYKLVVVSFDKRIPTFIAAIAPLIVASNGSFACWAGSGMETAFYTCLIVAGFLAAFRGNLVGSAVCAIGVSLSRPEGILIFLVFGLFHAVRFKEFGLRRIIWWFLVCLGVIAALFVARFFYYGEWLPNTYYAKVGGGLSAAYRGLAYLIHYAGDHEGLIIFGTAIMYGLLSVNTKQRFLALGAIALWLATIAAGGDGLPMYRFAVPALPIIAVLETQLIAQLYRAAGELGVKPLKLNVLSGVVVIFFAAVNLTPPIIGAYYDLYQYQKQVEVPRWTLVGEWLRKNAKPQDSLACVPIGAVSYYSGLQAIDMLGLNDKHIAHRKMPDMGKGWAGHEKRDGQYVLGRKPTYILAGNIDVTDKPRDTTKIPFIPYSNRAIWEREKDLYETDKIFTLYKPRSVEIAQGEFLNFYELKEEYR